MSTERTRLLSNETKPQYVFDSSIARERQRRVKQFQCCLCVIFICCCVVAIVVAVSYTIRVSDNNDEDNTTGVAPLETLLILTSKSWPLVDKLLDEETSNNETEWNKAMAAGQDALDIKDAIETKVKSPPLNSPSYKHQKLVATSKKAQLLSRIGYKEEFATRNFKKINNTRICSNKLNETGVCGYSPRFCSPFTRYRSYNGSCNNLKYPNNFGVAYQPFRRSLPSNYADGISQPRVGIDGTSLPSARSVSLIVHPPYNRNNEKFSVMLAVWGQFLDHDITATALSQGIDGTSISCCLNDQPVHPECFPVQLDKEDPYAVSYNVTCMEFVRSAPAPTCCLGPRQQMNQVSAFIDGSVVYSSDEDLVRKLRRMEKGELNMFLTEDNRTLLPVSKDVEDGCNRVKENEAGRYCFLAGDARSNENLHLTSMHLIWARQHNYIAQQLSAVNLHWNDERLFQETRRILGAQMQHITYKEFLPILLGPELMQKFDLSPQSSGYFTKYNDSIDPSIANNFATAAFRFAHSIIPGLMKFLANDTSSPEFIQLHQMLLDPFKLYQPGELDGNLRGAMDTTIEASDPYFTDELKKHLFERKSDQKTCGLDLVSLNIQRGRDHGLVGYNSWREHCGLRRARTFEQLRQDIDDDSLHNIQRIYRNVEDIDLYSGALSEKPLNGSILGSTITCLILDQFIRIKYGDRFWYENPQNFAPEELDEIRKTTLARIICDNSDRVEFSQPLVMEKINTNTNPVTACREIPAPNFAHWKETLRRVLAPRSEISVQVGG